MEAATADAGTEKADFEYLAKVFGPDEIQLCEIQAAGPGVSRIVNQLLEGCFENKFEIRFRTQRPRADPCRLRRSRRTAVCTLPPTATGSKTPSRNAALNRSSPAGLGRRAGEPHRRA